MHAVGYPLSTEAEECTAAFTLHDIAGRISQIKAVLNVRKWWNWQTHHLEGVAPKGVGVQIPPSAPSH